MPSGSISAYARNGKLYVAPNDGMVAIEPVFVTGPEVDHFATAVENAMAAVPRHARIWSNLRDYKSPFLAAAGIKSVREFERGLKLVTMEMSESGYVIQPWIPYPRERHGFAPDSGSRSTLAAGTPLRVVAEQVMKTLVDPKWPTR